MGENNQSVSNEGILEVLLPEIRAINTTSRETVSKLASMEERLNQVALLAEKLDKTINGNGKPGLRSVGDEHERRLAAIEAQHEAEKKKREEAQEAQRKEKEKEAERAEWRKFRWGLLFAGVSTILDLLVHIIHIPGT